VNVAGLTVLLVLFLASFLFGLSVGMQVGSIDEMAAVVCGRIENLTLGLNDSIRATCANFTQLDPGLLADLVEAATP